MSGSVGLSCLGFSKFARFAHHPAAVEFTLCCHPLPQILLQSALRVLQLKLLSTGKEHI